MVRERVTGVSDAGKAIGGRIRLALADVRKMEDGVVHLRYTVTTTDEEEPA